MSTTYHTLNPPNTARPSIGVTQGHTPFTHKSVRVSWFNYQWIEHLKKVLCQPLHFELHGISWNLPPPTPVTIDYLLLVVTDLDCGVSEASDVKLDEGYMPL